MQSDQSAVVGSASPLVFVSCYDTFGNLAHTPHGTEAKHSMYTYRLNLERGDLTLMSVSTEPCTNPAFLRYHPTQNILYACTESIHEEGLVVAYSVSPTTGQLSKLGAQSALGTSTCYLTVDNDAKHLLFVNYWDSTLGALPLTPTGLLAGPVCELLQPPNPIRKTKREDHLSSRQSEDHAHAIVLDPVHGRIAYVPDLGKECVKQFLYDRTSGKLVPAGTMAAGSGAGPHGPRYIEFHPFLNVGYLVNELGSTVSVFEFLDVEAATLEPSPEGKGYEPAAQPTLRLIQMVKTTPSAFPRALNTCGRIAVDPTGQFVLVSNRGHNSLAVFRVNLEGALQGTLSVVGYCHTSGRTPRHFQFDPSGRFLIVANQDTDTIAVFSFDAESGHLSFTGQLYDVPSPNFVCVQAPYSRRLAKL